MSTERRLSTETNQIELECTLWRCVSCGCFVSIYSVRTASTPVCPICRDAPLNLCGSYEDVLGMDAPALKGQKPPN